MLSNIPVNELVAMVIFIVVITVLYFTLEFFRKKHS
jgi:hypothetical protein